MQRNVIFAAIRRVLGRGFRQSEVVAIDRAIDAALGEACIHPLAVSDAGLTLIKQFEGCGRLRSDGRVEAYPDPGTGGAPWTIGWGATGLGIGPGTIWTRAQCDARLAQDIQRYAHEVALALDGAPTTQAQFDALVSFHYNTGAIARASLTSKHRAGDYAGAAVEFARWNRAGGRVMAGLARRRAAETRMYLGD